MERRAENAWSIDLSWKNLLLRWVTLIVGLLGYVFLLKLLGFDSKVDWELYSNLVALGTLILFVVAVYGRPKKD
ncbi:hypothetical protein CMUST_14370 [Corynebacterium mustelae]|uniref:Uncharacterized protein n=1 Tax=Corynebacterium mustelae TaxID=571915 RepID=A0A0G3H7S1_9CORY|nr:hypothetical protein [Corynebacterium mustelae]AKK07167.1 hypothetical protein CMUST_14370 [Corynebacterium mustelae]